MRPSPHSVVVLALLSVVACGKNREAAPAPTQEPTPVPAPPPAETAKGPPSRMNFGTESEPMTLMGRLTYEAQHRPAGVLRAEDVIAALKDAGIEVKPQQVLALSVRAAYCVAGSTPAGTGVTVCEYPGEAEAAAGRAYSLERMAAMKNRLLTVRRGTLLTVTTTAEPPESDVEGKKIVGVFEKL